MKSKSILTIAIIAALSGSGCRKTNDGSTDNTMSKIDYEFLTHANTLFNNQKYIQTWVAATGKYANGTIYNSMMNGYNSYTWKQHDPENTGVKEMVGTYLKITPDGNPDADHTSLLTQLKMLSGKAFDSVYFASEVKDHQALVDEMTLEYNFGSNSTIRHYAGVYLTTEIQHQQLTGQAVAALK